MSLVSPYWDRNKYNTIEKTSIEYVKKECEDERERQRGLGQRDQMERLFVQHLAFYNDEKLSIRIKLLPK